MSKNIKPVNGAAHYFASYDNNKPTLWMKIPADENCAEDRYYYMSSHQSMDVANLKADQMQRKENKSVLKHHPEFKQ